ncbi:iron complex outermembrane recepter protein [Chitinophaga sp. YR573]|nr:iron complex outermembrane recepter protein [Chitinophaga sp. YR573]
MRHNFIRCNLNYIFLNLIILIFSSYGAMANEVLSAIKGKVLTSDGEPAAYVTVQIKNTGHGTLTDQNGDFLFKKIKPGHYTLQVSLIGYETLEQEVEVETDKVSHVSLQLKVSRNQIKEIVVVGGKNKYVVNNPSSSLRLQTPLTEVPQNIQVVTKEVLNDQQVFNMSDGVLRNVSGAQRIAHWNTYTRINARGGQLTAFRNGMNTTISPFSPLTEDMSMVDRIEFIKGPAGFMLSNGEPSGIYNVVTKKPTGIDQKEFTLTVGSFETYRATGDFDGRLSKDGKLLYRLNVMGQLAASQRNFEYNNRYSIAPVIKYLIDDRTSFTAEYTDQYVQMNVIGSDYAFSKRKYADLPVSFTTAESNIAPTKIHDRSLLLVFEHQFNANWKFTAQGAYFHYNQEGSSMWPIGFTTAGNDSLLQRRINMWDALGMNKTAQMFLNGKFNTGSVQHTILAGLDMKYSNYYADYGTPTLLGDATFNIYKPVYTNPSVPAWDRSKDIRARGVLYNYGYNAGYVQDELGFFNNKVRLTLAARYTVNKYVSPYEGTYNDDKITPRVGLSYSVDKNTSAYFIYDQAFMQNPGRDYQDKNFKPLTGDNLEFGLKRDWFNGRFNSTVSVYQITKNNVLVADNEHTNPANGEYSYSKQTGQQQIKGVEVDLRGDIVRNLGVVINYAYTDAQISKDSDPKLVGNIVPGTSKHIQNTWMTYRVAQGVLNGLRLSAGYQYMIGRVAGMIYDKSENPLPDYFRLDAGIGYTSNKFSINLNVNNVFDKYLFTGGPSGDIFYWQAEPKRNARVSVGYKF